MKKIIALMLVLALTLSLVACGTKPNTEEPEEQDEIVETVNPEEIEEEKDEVKEETKKPEQKPQEEAKPEAKPEVKPEAKPEEKPEVKPETKPEPEAKTLGTKLLADFKAKASSMDALGLAEALLANPEILFGGGAMPVEEGYLSGFDNAEIKGFKTGVMFAPMIGSIPFVGYIFELANASDVPAFIANLEKNANKRWNICVEADEMVTGSVGNKVFFVMCPTSLDEE